MNKTSFASAAAGLLVLAGVSFAQPPGITPEMINTTLPLEGAPLAVAGPYKVTSEPASGSPGHVVFRPADAQSVSAERQAAGDGLGQRRLLHRQQSLLGVLHDDRVARVPGDEHRARAGRRAEAAERRRHACGARLGRERKRARRFAAQRQDRTGQGRGHGPVVRRISFGRARRRSAGQDDRRLQFRRPEGRSWRRGRAVPDVGLAAQTARPRAAHQWRRARLHDADRRLRRST